MPVRLLPATPPRILLIGVLSLVACGCSPSAESRLLDLAPGLSKPTARHLTADPDTALAAYAREAGFEVLAQSIKALYGGFSTESLSDYERSARTLMPALSRLVAVLASEYDYPGPLGNQRFLETLEPEDALDMWKLVRERLDTYRDPRLSDREKIKRNLRLLSEFERRGFLFQAAMCRSSIAEFSSQIGDDENYLRYTRESIGDFLRSGHYGMACQMLGVLGVIHSSAGRIDSMHASWQQVVDLADRHRMANQAARIRSFYAAYYESLGRLALSHSLIKEAQAVCRLYKGGAHEMRYVIAEMEFLARLGCWEIVGRLIQRVRVLEHELPSTGDLVYPILSLRFRQTEARYLMSQGKTGEAEEIYEEIRCDMRDQPWRLDYPRLLYLWSGGLVAAGDAAGAVPLIEEALAYAEDKLLPEVQARLLILLARANLEMGATAAAWRELKRFENLAGNGHDNLQREWVDHDALTVRLLLREGKRQEAVAAVVESFRRVERYARQMDATSHSYLWLAECQELRELFHELNRDDPSTGYGFEWYWRDLPRLLGGGPARAASAESFVDFVRSLSAGARRRIEETNGYHCLYSIRGDEVWRWVVSRAGIRRDVVPVPAGELRELVTSTVAMMAEDPGRQDAPPGAELVSKLRRLARVLLPPEVLQQGEAPSRYNLLISADNFLSFLPFEALDISDGEAYVPLLARHDVAYVRQSGVLSPRGPSASGTLVLVAPALSARLRRFNLPRPNLERALEEAAAVAAALPGTRVLRGALATEKEILASWEDTGVFYAATHVLRDPDTPYLSFVPVADPGDDAPLEASILDVGDIRSADLSRCDLVVLSGCSSGRPYVAADHLAPGLGDAFLDAGARAVIQTSWAVRDEEAHELMAGFIRRWTGESSGAVAALCAARRATMMGKEGVRHPFTWAAYSIKLGRL